MSPKPWYAFLTWTCFVDGILCNALREKVCKSKRKGWIFESDAACVNVLLCIHSSDQMIHDSVSSIDVSGKCVETV